MATVQYVQAKKTTLQVGISAAETGEIVLKRLVDIYGNALALSDFGTIIYLTIDPGGSSEEIISATGFTVNADSTVSLNAGIVRGLSAKSTYGSGGTASAHAAGVVVVVSNNPQLYASLVNLADAQTIDGLKTFTVAPKSSADAVLSTELVRKSQLDAAVLGSLSLSPVVEPGTGGAVLAIDQLVYQDASDGKWKLSDADTAATVENVRLGITRGACAGDGSAITDGVTVSGLHVASTAIFTANTKYFASNTAGGFSTSAGTKEVTVGYAHTTTQFAFAPRYDQQLTENQQDLIAAIEGGTDFYGASAVGTDAYAITIAPAIAAYATGMKFRFKADVANTGACTLAVSGLSALAIKKLNDQDLATGDIEAGQIVEVVYDGVDFQMQSPTATSLATVKFGGTGADGALTLTSGATNIDLGSARIVVKNYTTISITGTGSLTFTNPHANGTIVILRAQGDVTLTSSTAPMIDASGLGAVGVTTARVGAGTDNGTNGTDAYGILYKSNGGVAGATTGVGAGGAITSSLKPAETITQYITQRYPFVTPGAAGATGVADGNGATNTSGRGGGGLVIECGGALNFTTASGISVAGKNGTDGSGGTACAGGAGGGGGVCIILYATLTANSGTITVSGGTGGLTSGAGALEGGGGGASPVEAGTTGVDANPGVRSGGNGASGFSLVEANTMFV